MSNKIANIAPDMSMYRALKSLPYSTSSAIAEYIDNSIQSYLDNPDKDNLLDVTIKWYTHDYRDPKLKNSIVIVDNSVGMTEDELIKALKPGKTKNSKYKNGSLNQFGMGLKSASVWLSDNWHLDTSSRTEDKVYGIKFNLTELLNNGEDHVEVASSDVENNFYGTKVSILNIEREQITEELIHSISDKLLKTYQLFTNENNLDFKKIMNLKSIINDSSEKKLNFDNSSLVPMVFEEVVKVKGKFKKVKGTKQEWKQKIDFVHADKKVTGFLAVTETMDQDKSGILFFKNKKLILNSNDDSDVQIAGTLNKHGTKRVFGQIHLNDFPVTVTKDKFDFNIKLLADDIKKQERIKSLIKQAENYRTKDLGEIEVDSNSNSTGSKGNKDQIKDQNSQNNSSGDKTSGTKNNGSSGSNIKKLGNNRVNNPKDPKERTILFDSALPVPGSYKKACALHKDLRTINVDEHPQTVALALRVFVELTVRIYLDCFNSNKELKNMLKNILEKNVEELSLDDRFIKAAKNTFNEKMFTNNLNAVTHNPEYSISADSLKTDWDNISALMHELWEKIGESK